MIRLSLLLVPLLFFLFPKYVFAVDLSITHPTEITMREFELSYKTSGAKKGTNYLRVMIRKSGENNYVSETWNGKEWYSGGDGLSYLPVQVGNFESSGTIRARLKDGVNSGDYEIALRRYSQSGAQAQTTEFKTISLKLASPPSTPTPTDAKPLETQLSLPTPTVAAVGVGEDVDSNLDLVLGVKEDVKTVWVQDGDQEMKDASPEIELVAENNLEGETKTVLDGSKDEAGKGALVGNAQLGPLVFGIIGLVAILISIYQIVVKVKYLI